MAIIFDLVAILSSQLNTHNFMKRLHRGPFNLLLFVSQSHTYVNLTDFDLTAGSVSQSGLASVSNDSSPSQSKADSLSSQMARLSKYSSLQLYLLRMCNACTYCNVIYIKLTVNLFVLQVQVNQIHYHRK